MAQEGEVTQVTHVSGAQRLMNSILCAVCGAPLLLLGASFLLGMNEKHAVCESRAIASGAEVVKEVGCDEIGSNTLVLFSCDIQKDGLTFGPDWAGYASLASFLPADMSYQGTGLDVSVEMLQCVETAHSTTTKDKSGGGGETTVTTYTYAKKWVSHPVDSHSFRNTSSRSFISACGAQNPAWPAGTPMSQTLYAPRVKVGAFTLQGQMVSGLPLDAPVALESFPGWTPAGAGTWTNDDLAVESQVGGAAIGTLRVRLSGTDWTKPRLTVLGHERRGVIRRWKAPSSWLCSGFTLSHIVRGEVSKEDLFDALQEDSNTKLWLVRVVGFGLMWFGFSLIAKPLGVVADCIPLCGPCLGDAVDTITCALSCLPATACCFLVAGVVWVVMRPMVGGPMLLVSLAIFGALAFQKAQRKAAAGREVELAKPLA